MIDNIFDLYVDCLLSSFGSVTATGLSELLNGLISHDKITRRMTPGVFPAKAGIHELAA